MVHAHIGQVTDAHMPALLLAAPLSSFARLPALNQSVTVRLRGERAQIVKA